MRKKRRLKKWVLYAIFTALFVVLILLLDRLQLIQVVSNDTLDITKACILLVVYEFLRFTIKAIIKREKESE